MYALVWTGMTCCPGVNSLAIFDFATFTRYIGRHQILPALEYRTLPEKDVYLLHVYYQP